MIWLRARLYHYILVFGSLVAIWKCLVNFRTVTLGRPYDTWISEDYLHFNATPNPYCSIFNHKIAQDVQIVLKTGAAEVFDKLLVHLTTVTSCIPPSDLIIFSDLDENIGPYQLHDAFRAIPEKEKSSSPDFGTYHKQKLFREHRKGVRDLQEGRKLDKYKFLPMMERMWWDFKPKKKWYVFIETDTFVVWENLFHWLAHMDADQPLYMGSPVWPKGKYVFAHGGSGFVLSRPALRLIASAGRPYFEGTSLEFVPGTHQFGFDLTRYCCGDEVLAQAFGESGLKLHGYWPMFNGERPSSVRFGKEHWCEPVFTLHHLSPEEVNEFWQWYHGRLQETEQQAPLLFEDIFHFIEAKIDTTREDWDNMSEDIEISHTTPGQAFDSMSWVGESVEMCRAACLAEPSCYQFRLKGQSCTLSRSIRLGHPVYPNDEAGTGRCISGGNLKIRTWKMEQGEC
ncbi:hypothetical protein PV11_09573 [Exophiala sideris]|uniref:N-acetylgalactosaminide beta-1,3-galactosyltransferase n=1 Tax=Exophiala sideris TaxID=1016849 RepID=A0A0D1YS67_9EURO|nr:hypothetical protein PV11_09573 [Exophiala sideris]